MFPVDYIQGLTHGADCGGGSLLLDDHKNLVNLLLFYFF